MTNSDPLADFKTRVQPAGRAKNGRLDPHADAIKELRQSGYSWPQIAEYLETQGVTVTSYRDIASFAHRRKLV